MNVRMLQLSLAFGALTGLACASMPTQPKPTVSFSGRISDQLGRGLSGVELLFSPHMYSLSTWYEYQVTTTDSTGAYSAQLVAGAWDILIFEPHNAFLAGPRSIQVTVSPEDPRFDLVYQGFRLSGKVIGPTGAVLDSAHVLISSGARFAEVRSQGGTFSFFLPFGTYALTAFPGELYSGFPSGRMGGVSVASDTTLDIVLQGDLLEGLVAGPGGMPLERVVVTASGEVVSQARTGSNGRYALYAPQGDYRFTCQPAEAYILTRISSQRTITGPAMIDFDLSGTEWTGTVRTSATSQPISGVSVRAELFADDYDRAAVATTDPAGQFKLVLEPNREYSLAFSEPGMVGFTIPSIFAAADTTFDIVLDPTPTP